MREILLNRTPILVQDHEFENGFEIGYMHTKVDFIGKNVPITDNLLSTILSQPLSLGGGHITSRYHAGYQVGVVFALLEKEPQRTRFQIVGKISLVDEIGG